MSDGMVGAGTPANSTPATPGPMGAAVREPVAGLAPPAAPAPVDDAPAPVVAERTPTLADGGNDDDAGAIRAPADWPSDWRSKLAGEDAKALKRLERFGSPADIFKSFRELEAKLSSGKGAPAKSGPPPADAPAEDIAAWRKENGIPENAEQYDTSLGEGFVWGDADKPLLDSFTQYAHAKNWDNARLKEGLAWYAENQRAAAERLAIDDQNYRTESEDALRKEWGNDYRRNINMISTLFEGAGDIQNRLFTARTSDGKLIGNDPAIARYLSGLARELNPVATIIPGGNTDPMKGIDGRKAEIEKMMGDYNSAYHKGPQSVALQQEYRDLIDAEQKFKSRNAA